MNLQHTKYLKSIGILKIAFKSKMEYARLSYKTVSRC